MIAKILIREQNNPFSKKSIEDFRDKIAKEFLKRNISINIFDNKIDFHYKPRFTTHSGKNQYRAFKLLRHGKVIIIKTPIGIQIKCFFSIQYLIIISAAFGLILPGLSILYSDFNLITSLILFLIVGGIFFIIGLVSLLFTVYNIIGQK
jgi:hypothetical protein